MKATHKFLTMLTCAIVMIASLYGFTYYFNVSLDGIIRSSFYLMFSGLALVGMLKSTPD